MIDYITRATAADEEIRAFAAMTRDLMEEARNAHNTSPATTAALERLLAAGSMMGSMMKEEDDLLTVKIQGDGPIGGLTVTADSREDVKDYVSEPSVMLPSNAQGKLDVGSTLGVGVLSVIQDTGVKEPYVGRTTLVSGEIAEDLTYYYAISEQILTSVALGVLMNRDNTVRQAGGFIIQLMPGTSEEMIGRLESRLAEISSITSLLGKGQSPEEILEHILGEFNLHITDRMDTRFACNCDKARVEKALISIGKKDLQEMTDDDKPIEVNCHFCNKNYTFEAEKLGELCNKASH